MNKIIVAIFTFVMLNNLVFAQSYENEFYTSSIAEVQNKLKLESHDLDKISEVLKQLKKDLKSAKVRRNIALGIGIPVAILGCIGTIRAIKETWGADKNIYASISNQLIKMFGVMSGATAIGMGTYIWLTQNQVNQIERAIAILESKIVKRQNIINKQIQLLQE